MRLRVPDEGETVVHDVIRGDVTFPHSAIDDFVIARSDGSPLYNLAVSVDDHDMEITHVVRGEDHLSNTPAQILIQRALGAEPPVYAHLPLLHGPDGKKLSKRHGAASVQELRAAGYLPSAVRNYLALLGWGYDESTTFFTTDELVERFSLERVSKNPAVFDEQKLAWMNANYLRGLEIDELVRLLEERYGRDDLRAAAEISQEKLRTLDDFWPFAGFLFERREIDAAAWEKVMKDGAADLLGEAREALAGLERLEQRHRRGRASTRRGGSRREAEAGLPARPGGHLRHHGVARDLRIGGRPGPRGDARAHRCRAEFGSKNRALEPNLKKDSTIRPVVPIRAGNGIRIPTPRKALQTPMATAAPAKKPAAKTRPEASSTRRHNEGHGRRLTAAFEALEAFPALAESRNRLLTTVREENTSVADVVEVVESDVALVIAVLRIANRARSPKRGKIAAVPKAVEVLTPGGVEALASRTATFDFFERTPVWDVMPERFRLHAVATQRAAERIARESGFEQRDELLVSALLHDIGKLVLVHAYPGYPQHIHGEARTPEERVSA